MVDSIFPGGLRLERDCAGISLWWRLDWRSCGYFRWASLAFWALWAIARFKSISSHPFITYLCSRFGLAGALQSVMPDGSVLVALVVLGFLLAYVLALPGAVQWAFNALKAKIAAWVDETESSAGMLAKRPEGK